MANLSALAGANTQCFVTLCDKYAKSNNALSASLQDIYARFEQWSNNIGARQPYHVSTSLERRVRAATKLQDLFRARLKDLQEDLDDLILALGEAQTDLLQDVPYIAFASTAPEDDLSVEPNPLGDITELLKAAGEDISALFKLSIVARKATTRDRYARALARVLPDKVLSEEAEAEIIGDQFPTLRFTQLHWLRLRLTQANNTRRRFLKYSEEHATAIARSNNFREDFNADVARELVDDHVQSSGVPETNLGGAAEEADSATISNNTTASTARDTIFDAIERTVEQPTPADAESFISYATQTRLEAVLSVPSLEIASKGSEVFVCPYCRSEQAITSQAAWRRHIFADLRAYVCTHKSCELRMFESSHAWLAHELSEHFASRHCPYCEDHNTISTERDLRSHLTQMHYSRFKSEQLPQLVQASISEPDHISARACHFCDWTTKLRYENTLEFPGEDALIPVQRYRRHVGSHLEQIALLTITSSTQEPDTELGSADERSDSETHNSRLPISSIKVGSQLESVAFSPDGRLVASAAANRMVQLWDVATGAEVKRLEGHGDAVKGVAFSPNGLLIASASADRTVRLWEVGTGVEVKRIKGHGIRVAGWITSVAFSPNGQLVASAAADRTVRLWDVSTGAEVKRLEGHGNLIGGLVRDVAFSPDGQLVASASDDRTVRLWEVATGAEVKRLEHENWVRSVAFSPEGKLVASASDDRTVRLWEVSTGLELKRFEHGTRITGVVFSPDGNLIASGCDDRIVRLWEIAVGAELKRLEGHEGRITGVAFSPDGHLVASASDDRTVRLWSRGAAVGDETSERNRSFKGSFQKLFNVRM